MKIKDDAKYQTKLKPLSFKPSDSVADAVKDMAEYNYGCVVVVDPQNVPVGIVSERDLMKRLLAKGLDQTKTKLKDIMTSDIYVATEEDEMLDWFRQMSNERFRHLPVVDKDGKLVCLMSQGDFVAQTWPQLLHQFRETAKASLAPNYQVAFIVMALLLYAIVIPLLFNLFG